MSQQPWTVGATQVEDGLPTTNPKSDDRKEQPDAQKHGLRSRMVQRYKNWGDIFGPYSVNVMIFGTLTMIGSSAILLYLWIGTYLGSRTYRGTPGLLNIIVRYSAAPQVVTVCAAALRTSISLQLALLTAAIASVIIEESGTSLGDAAALSIKRASGAGLLEFLWLSEQKRLWRRPRGRTVGFLTIVAGVVFLLTAFASTILLYDFSDVAVAGLPKTILRNVNPIYPRFLIGNGLNWKMAAPATWRFALMDNEKIQGRPQEEDERDTGDMIVAMLPFIEAERRTSLTRYEGPAAVSNFRTFCYAPEDADITDLSLISNGQTGLSINGSLSFEPDSDIVRSLLVESNLYRATNDSEKHYYFHCPLLMSPDVGYYSREEPLYMGMCRLNFTWGAFFRTTPLVVLNITNLPALEKIYDDELWEDPVPQTLETRRSSDKSTWTSVRKREGNDSDSTPPALLSLSVCITYVGAVTRNVLMRGSAVDGEPAATGERRGENAESPRMGDNGGLDMDTDQAFTDDNKHEAPYGWDASQLTHQLHGRGPDGRLLSPTDRGLLELVDAGDVQSLRNFSMEVLVSENLEVDDVDILPSPSDGILIRNGTQYDQDSSVDTLGQPQFMPHMVLSSEFLDVYSNTESLPLAMQSLMFRLWQTHYATYLLSTNETYNVNVTFATTTLLPSQWIGLGIVLGLVVIHLGVVVRAMALYKRYARGSRLWHPWQAVAQLNTLEMEELVEFAKNADERDVKKWIEEQGREGESYVVTRVGSTRRYQLQAMRRTKGRNEEDDITENSGLARDYAQR